MSRRSFAEPAEPAESAATGSQTRRPLWHCFGVTVVDFHCHAHVEPLGGEEVNPCDSIVFVRRGAFALTERGDTLLADANQILFFNRGQVHRYAHPLPGGDECTVLALEEDRARAASERFAPPHRGEALAPFPAARARSTPRAARLHLELLALGGALGGASVSLAAEEVVAELVDEALRTLHGTPPRSARDGSTARRRRRETVEAAKLMLHRALAAPPSLCELAAELDCSPFHLSRIFRAETGLGLRHYVRRLRARLAADRLRRGARDLTALALDLGFFDHSHFTNSFRREWDVAPSRIRPALDLRR